MGNLRGYFAGAFLGLVVAFGMNVAHASDLYQACMNNVSKDCESWAAAGGNGSGAPRGLTKDTRAELASGEKYILTGKIETIEGRPYFQISFKNYPWLASAARVKNPFYRLLDSSAKWKRYVGREVTIIATARYVAKIDKKGRTLLEVALEPSASPFMDELQPNYPSRSR